MNKSQLVSDIILRLTKGKPADDLELEPSQVEFWINLALDEMVKEELDGLLEVGDRIPEFFVVREACKFINQEDLECIDDVYDRLYITLSKPVFNLFGDKAVVRVKASDGSIVRKSRLSTVDFLENIEFAKPASNNLVYYRDGKKKLVLKGVPVSMKDTISIIVWYVPQVELECFGPEEDLPIPADMINRLQERVEEIARRQMSGFGDVTNDGFDDLPNNQVNG